jgi:hypothetical protein
VAKCRVTYLDLDGSWKSADLSGSKRWNIDGRLHGAGAYGPRGWITGTEIIRTLGGVYIVRGFSHAWPGDEQHVRILPELAASHLCEAGISPLPADLEPHARPVDLDPPRRENDERDKFIYEQGWLDVSWKTIQTAVARNGWDSLGISGLHKAAAAYAERHKLPPVPSRKPGRRNRH